MNRRRFVQLFAGGIIGTAAALHLPGSLVARTDLGRRSACELLRRAWLGYYEVHHREPSRLIVGRDLFDAFGEELTVNQRFTSAMSDADAYNHWIPERWLFKNSRVQASARAGWTITALA